MSTGILLLGHGSKIENANAELFTISKMVKEKGGYAIVETAFLQFRKPSLCDGVASIVKQGAEKIIIVPYFLYMGIHVQEDLPKILVSAKEKFPFIEMVISQHLGVDQRMVEMVCERVEESVSGVRIT